MPQSVRSLDVVQSLSFLLRLRKEVLLLDHRIQIDLIQQFLHQSVQISLLVRQ